MKAIFSAWLLVLASVMCAQSNLGRIFAPDTTGSMGGRHDVVSPKFTIKNDTVLYNADLYFLSAYFNTSNYDSLRNIADTIIFRNNRVILYDSTNTPYDTLSQRIGLYWLKSLSTDNIVTASEDPVYCWGSCCLFRHESSTGYICDEEYVCDLANSFTLDWCSYFAYTKVFEDNFEGHLLNEKAWVIGFGTGERMINSSDLGIVDQSMVEVSNGTLKLKARKLNNSLVYNFQGVNYTRDLIYGSVTSVAKFSYGKYEIRARIPDIDDVNPAYWLASGHHEIDGFEFFTNGRSDLPTMTVYSDNMYEHFSTKCKAYENKVRIKQMRAKDNGLWTASPALPNLHDADYVSPNTFSDGTPVSQNGWHIFTLVWDPNYITWWIDDYYGVTYYNIFEQGGITFNPYHNCSCTGCVVQQQYNYPANWVQNVTFMLTNGVRGDGPTPGTTPTFEIDWVKIYQRDNCAAGTKTFTSGAFNFWDSYNAGHAEENYITGNNLVFGGAGDSNPFRIYYLQPWDPNNPYTYWVSQVVYSRADQEIQLLDGFEVWDGAVFEGTIAYDGSLGGNADCVDTQDFWTQYLRTVGDNQGVPLTESEKSNSEVSRVYPNPAQTSLYIGGITQFNNIEIINATLQTVKVLGSEREIDISTLAAGLYFIRIYAGNRVLIHKFIKQ